MRTTLVMKDTASGHKTFSYCAGWQGLGVLQKKLLKELISIFYLPMTVKVVFSNSR